MIYSANTIENICENLKNYSDVPYIKVQLDNESNETNRTIAFIKEEAFYEVQNSSNLKIAKYLIRHSKRDLFVPSPSSTETNKMKKCITQKLDELRNLGMLENYNVSIRYNRDGKIRGFIIESYNSGLIKLYLHNTLWILDDQESDLILRCYWKDSR